MTPIELEAELNDLRMSKEAQPLFDAVKRHIAENVDPITEELFRLGEGRADRWSWAPGQLELLEGAKAKAKAAGLWNFFLPHGDTGTPLTNLDYAYIAAELGKSPLASESLNCSAPDTGNMEVLEMVGTPEQKDRWLKPLLNGEIRSAYVMTEPGVASSDASNLETSATLEGDEWVINGEKYFISGAGDPRRARPDVDHQQHPLGLHPRQGRRGHRRGQLRPGRRPGPRRADLGGRSANPIGGAQRQRRAEQRPRRGNRPARTERQGVQRRDRRHDGAELHR